MGRASRRPNSVGAAMLCRREARSSLSSSTSEPPGLVPYRAPLDVFAEFAHEDGLRFRVSGMK